MYQLLPFAYTTYVGLYTSFKLQWTVVQFITNNEDNPEVSVVPLKWLIKQEDGMLCYWPSSKKARRYIRKASEPNKDLWKQYPAENLLGHPVSYEDAIKYEKKVEESNSSGNEFQSQRKKTKKLDSDYVELESSSDSDVFIPEPPKLSIVISNTPNDHIELHSSSMKESEHNTSSDDTRSIGSSELMPPPPIPLITATEVGLTSIEKPNVGVCGSNSEVDLIDLQNAEIMFEDPGMVLKTPEKLKKLQSYSHEQLTGKLDQILKQTIENRIILERIVNCISNDMGKCDTGIQYDTVPKNPFKSYKDLLKYDKKLSECEEMQNQLENVFTVCGGASQKENIIRGLKKIFSDKLAKRCSWLGRKNNFPLGDLRTMHILRAAVRKNFTALRDKEFEIVVANWLRQANLRYRRNKERQTPDV